jgi:hypothetical protein
MKNRALSHKPKFSKAKSSARTVSEVRAQAGEGIPYILARAASIPAVVASSLEDGKFCFLKDLVLAFEKVAETLLTFEPDGGQAFVMVDRKAAQKMVLTLVLGGLKNSELLSAEFDPLLVVKESQKEIFSTIAQVKEVLARCDNPDLTIEAFRKDMASISNPALVKKILTAISINAPILMAADGTNVSLGLEKKVLKDLPSDKKHTLDVVITSGFDEESKTATAVICDLIGADASLFEVSSFIKVLCVDDEMRLSLLVGQAARKRLRVTVSVPRVPLYPYANSTLSTTLEEVAILDFDGSEVLKGLLFEQLKLDL